MVGPNATGLASLIEETVESSLPAPNLKHAPREGHVSTHSEKAATGNPRRKLLPETDHADTLINDSEPPELLRKYNSVVSASQFVVFCYGSPNRLIHCLPSFSSIHSRG